MPQKVLQLYFFVIKRHFVQKLKIGRSLNWSFDCKLDTFLCAKKEIRNCSYKHFLFYSIRVLITQIISIQCLLPQSEGPTW